MNESYAVASTLGFANAIFMGAAEFGSYVAVLAVIVYGTFLILNQYMSVDFISTFFLETIAIIIINNYNYNNK